MLRSIFAPLRRQSVSTYKAVQDGRCVSAVKLHDEKSAQDVRGSELSHLPWCIFLKELFHSGQLLGRPKVPARLQLPSAM